MSATEPGTCGWCRQHGPDRMCVGIVETGSGPSRFLFACDSCRTQYRIIPLEQHPEGTDGKPRFLAGPHAMGAHL